MTPTEHADLLLELAEEAEELATYVVDFFGKLEARPHLELASRARAAAEEVRQAGREEAA